MKELRITHFKISLPNSARSIPLSSALLKYLCISLSHMPKSGRTIVPGHKLLILHASSSLGTQYLPCGRNGDSNTTRVGDIPACSKERNKLASSSRGLKCSQVSLFIPLGQPLASQVCPLARKAGTRCTG